MSPSPTVLQPVQKLPAKRHPWCKSRLCGLVVLLGCVSMGCNGSDNPIVSHGGPVHDHVSLVDALRAQGLTVEPTGPVSQPFFPISGQALTVNGQDIQVFEFDDPSATESQVNEISPDGMTIGGTAVHWIGPPHFFSTGKIIVLYVGTNPMLLEQLEMALGKQIAGASP